MYQKGATNVRNFDQNFSLINCNVEHSIKNKHFFYLHNTWDLLQNFAEIDFVRFVNSLRLKWKTDSIGHVRMITVFACILRKDQYFPAHETNMSKSGIFFVWRDLVSIVKIVECQNLFIFKSLIYSPHFQIKIFFESYIS